MRENYYSKIVLCFKGSHQNKNPKGGWFVAYVTRGGAPLPAGGLGLANVTHRGGDLFWGHDVPRGEGGQRCPRGGMLPVGGGGHYPWATLFNPSLNNSNVSGVHKIVHVLYLVKGEESGKNRGV